MTQKFNEVPVRSYSTPERAAAAAAKLPVSRDMAYIIASARSQDGSIRHFPVFLPKADQINLATGLSHAGYVVFRN